MYKAEQAKRKPRKNHSSKTKNAINRLFKGYDYDIEKISVLENNTKLLDFERKISTKATA
jgi:hypothetical protein